MYNMLNVYEMTYYYRINYGDWFEKYSSPLDNHYCLINSDENVLENVKWQNLSWDMFNSALKNHFLGGLERGKTFFAGKPYIRIYDTRHEHYDTYFDDDERTFSVKVQYTKINPTVEWLQKNLNANEFIQYFKSRGMMICPIT